MQDLDISCKQKALTWIAASSPLHLGSERMMGPTPDNSCSPLSFKVCFKAPNCFGGSTTQQKRLWDHCPYWLQPHTESSKGPANVPTTVPNVALLETVRTSFNPIRTCLEPIKCLAEAVIEKQKGNWLLQLLWQDFALPLVILSLSGQNGYHHYLVISISFGTCLFSQNYIGSECVCSLRRKGVAPHWQMQFPFCNLFGKYLTSFQHAIRLGSYSTIKIFRIIIHLKLFYNLNYWCFLFL